MLEQVYGWLQDGGAWIAAAGATFGGAIVAARSAIGALGTLKEALPSTVTESIDSQISQLQTVGDQFKLEETIINCKAKLESTVLSDEVKGEYLALMTKAQEELRTTYGIIKEIPSDLI